MVKSQMPPNETCNRFQCNVCIKSFKYQYKLKIHEGKIHGNQSYKKKVSRLKKEPKKVELFKCGFCESHFAIKSNLDQGDLQEKNI